MSILNQEQLDAQITREVEVVNPIRIHFQDVFRKGITPVLLIDPKNEIDVSSIAETDKAHYIDLSQPLDYPTICRIVKDATAIIFDNIDKIPESDNKEYIQNLVKYALRNEDEVPTSNNTSISFTNYRVGASCAKDPDYLYEGSAAMPLTLVVPE